MRQFSWKCRRREAERAAAFGAVPRPGHRFRHAVDRHAQHGADAGRGLHHLQPVVELVLDLEVLDADVDRMDPAPRTVASTTLYLRSSPP